MPYVDFDFLTDLVDVGAEGVDLVLPVVAGHVLELGLQSIALACLL